MPLFFSLNSFWVRCAAFESINLDKPHRWVGSRCENEEIEETLRKFLESYYVTWRVEGSEFRTF